MAYGDKRDYPKIDIYGRARDGGNIYLGTTTWAKTCKEAVERYNARPERKHEATHAHFQD